MGTNNILELNKTYEYRKHLRLGFWSYVKWYLVLAAMIGILLIGTISTNGDGIKDIVDVIVLGVIIIGIVIIFMVELIILYFAVIRRFKKIKVTLKDDCIVYSNLKKEIIIPYEDIEKVVFSSIKYTGGWVKIVYKGGNIRLTVVLENIGDFLYELKKILDDKGKSNTYNEKKMFSFFKTASFSDEGWERVYESTPFQLGVYFISSVLTIVILLFTNKTEENQLIVMGSILAPLLGYILSEILIGSKVRKRVIDGEYKLKPRDAEKERRLIRRFIIVATVIYIIGILVFKVVG